MTNLTHLLILICVLFHRFHAYENTDTPEDSQKRDISELTGPILQKINQKHRSFLSLLFKSERTPREDNPPKNAENPSENTPKNTLKNKNAEHTTKNTAHLKIPKTGSKILKNKQGHSKKRRARLIKKHRLRNCVKKHSKKKCQKRRKRKLQREKAKEYRQKQESVMKPKDDPYEKVDFENVVTETAQKGAENKKYSGFENDVVGMHASDSELTTKATCCFKNRLFACFYLFFKLYLFSIFIFHHFP